MVVLRVPLRLDPAGPDPEGAKKLVEFFGAPVAKTPATSVDAAAQVLAASQKTQRGLVDWQLVGKPAESIKNNRRYISYDFVSSVCQGTIVEGSGGKRCERPGQPGEVLEVIKRRHAIKMTVTDEGTTGDDQTYYLWFLDISVRDADYEATGVKEVIETLQSSFELGDEAVLEKERVVEVTKEQLEQLQKYQQEGKTELIPASPKVESKIADALKSAIGR
jgi:hypothetical protein